MNTAVKKSKVETVTIKGRDIIAYLSYKKRGFVTVWCGEGLICMKKEVSQ